MQSAKADPVLRYSLGIDIGGTFTDIDVHDRIDGTQLSRKILTTHDEPERGVVEGIKTLLAEHRLAPQQFERVVHATTLFTNALIERKGAVTGLITTEGFRDALEIGRERKFELYDLGIENPAPLVPRELRTEVSERIRADGRVVRPLERAEVEDRVRFLRARGVTSIAVVFLHAYLDPTHEAEAARIIADCAPDLFVTTSHEVVREIREYERSSTTVANAYVKPLAHKYLDRMAAEIRALGIEAPLLLLLSNGGLTHIEEAKRVPVQLLESGPAAGALVAAYFGRREQQQDLLAFDMGGTTAKLSLVDGGEPLIAHSFEAARQKRFTEGSGLPIRISTIELIEIGAGGGSIAHEDEIGLLKVGPESAGSQPGPAAYGLGGVEPTVTDANLTLGYLNPAYFAGGALAIDDAAARNAVTSLAKRLGLAPLQVAWGIHDVVNENMASAARVHIAERGRDPRRYSLLCTGGGGPVHGYYVARKLGLKQIICPPSAGVASALGLLVAPARVDRVAAIGLRLEGADWKRLEASFKQLEAEARKTLDETGHYVGTATVRRAADARCVGQGFDLLVPLPPGPYDTADGATVGASLHTAFVEAYRAKFGRSPPGVPVEFIHARVSVSVSMQQGDVVFRPDAAVDTALKGHRPAYFPEPGDFMETAVYDRYRLAPGDHIKGPAVVEDDGSTLVVGPGGTITVLPSHSILVTIA
jgi:N-methylhydantoinase A